MGSDWDPRLGTNPMLHSVERSSGIIDSTLGSTPMSGCDWSSLNFSVFRKKIICRNAVQYQKMTYIFQLYIMEMSKKIE